MMLFHIGRCAQIGDIVAFGEVKTRLFHQRAELLGLLALPPGGRGIFQDAGNLRIAEI